MDTFKILNKYTNGNCIVTIYNDGTKVRFTPDDDFLPEFPESIDIKITNYCDRNCLMCHEQSSINGKHADLNSEFLNTLVAGTELAIGGGNPLSHPELISFLNRMKEKGIICNLTVNQEHFEKNIEYLQKLIDEKLIYGLGISVLNENHNNEIIDFALKNKNTVLHLIAGIVNKELLEKFYDKNIKILFLGYKKFGRGLSYYSKSVEDKLNFLRENVIDIGKHFSIISFDNLAISQLDMKNQLPEDVYENHYLGDDGMFTMYIDLVKQEFAKSSTEQTRYPLKKDIKEMFSFVRNLK